MKNKLINKTFRVESIRTDNITDVTYDIKNDMFIHKDSNVQALDRAYVYIHLTSDDVFQNGDHVVLNYPRGKEVIQLVEGVPFMSAEFLNSENHFRNCGHRKIVATTDDKLSMLVSAGTNEDTLGVPIDYEQVEEIYYTTSYPSLKESFLKEFCSRNGVDEVNVSCVVYNEFSKHRLYIDIHNEVTTNFIE